MESTIPIEPQIPGYTANRRMESNSIRHMTKSALGESRTVPTKSSQILAAQPGDFGEL